MDPATPEPSAGPSESRRITAAPGTVPGEPEKWKADGATMKYLSKLIENNRNSIVDLTTTRRRFSGPPGPPPPGSQDNEDPVDNRDRRTRGSSPKLRRDDIGIFHPQWEDPDGIGLVAHKKSIIFTDINDFSTRPALLWWNSHITQNERNTLQEEGLIALLDALKGRFEPDPVTATIKFTSDKLTLKDIAANEFALSQFFNTKLKHARTMGLLADDNVN
ncbi:hypothetical protein V8F33_014131 [Rhypophila sp. PSN 637]